MATKTIGTFGKFIEAEKVNPYIETMEAFKIAADKEPETSWTVEMDASRETAERVLIAAAANAVDRTARLRSRDDSKREKVGEREKSGNAIYDGTVILTFTLSEKHKPRKVK